MLVKEQDILKQTPPNGDSAWTEEFIRAYQESHGINYGGTVYEFGKKPHRIWSNTRTDFDNIISLKATEETTNTSIESILREEMKRLQAALDVEKAKNLVLNTNESINSHSEEDIPVHTGVERHGLHPSQMDKRTKAYQEYKKQQGL